MGGMVDLPNFLATLFLIEESLEVVSMSHPDSKIAKMKSQADLPKRSSCLMLFALHPSRFLCLRKHMMLLMLLLRNLFVLKRNVAVKLPSHKLGSAGTLALYGITKGEENSMEILVSPIGAKLSASSRDACGLEGGREKLKLMMSSAEGGEGLVTSISMLQLAATCSA